MTGLTQLVSVKIRLLLLQRSTGIRLILPPYPTGIMLAPFYRI